MPQPFRFGYRAACELLPNTNVRDIRNLCPHDGRTVEAHQWRAGYCAALDAYNGDYRPLLFNYTENTQKEIFMSDNNLDQLDHLRQELKAALEDVEKQHAAAEKIADEKWLQEEIPAKIKEYRLKHASAGPTAATTIEIVPNRDDYGKLGLKLSLVPPTPTPKGPSPYFPFPVMFAEIESRLEKLNKLPDVLERVSNDPYYHLIFHDEAAQVLQWVEKLSPLHIPVADAVFGEISQDIEKLSDEIEKAQSKIVICQNNLESTLNTRKLIDELAAKQKK